jgi:murein L,D-transpeptidase YcbB/YkuD
LIETIRNAAFEGLNPGDYHLAEIEELLKELPHSATMREKLDPGCLADLDLLLTDAFFTFCSHIISGRVDPVTITPVWQPRLQGVDMGEFLRSALEEQNIEDALNSLLPSMDGYKKLRDYLNRYRRISVNGGWPAVPEGPKMAKGAQGERVAALKARLAVTGDLIGELPGNRAVFDEPLVLAVKRFQMRHGLGVDGVVGQETLNELNVTADERIGQIEVNLERWRWLPQHFDDRYVLINIADYRLDVVELDHTVMTMKVIVGKQYRRTPVFSSKMYYLVFNPSWNVPKKLAVEDVIPKILKDPQYLARQNMRVLQGWGANEVYIDQATIDWAAVNEDNFKYRIRQDPSPHNSLGRVKFMFPNEFSVYMHDTPAKGLFGKSRRDFSSGCIRVEKPFELAEYLLRDHPDWTKEKIFEGLSSLEEKAVSLPEPVAVHVLYWTAWVDEEGTLQFRQDVNRRDGPIYQALKMK